MVHNLSGLALRTSEQPALAGPVTAGDSLFAALFGSSTVGVAICDRQFRFRAINDALASMNGIPAEAHLGKTLRAVLGSAAAKVQPAFEHGIDLRCQFNKYLQRKGALPLCNTI